LNQAELDLQIVRIKQLAKHKESEETWEYFDRALNNLTLWIQEYEAYKYKGFVNNLKDLKRFITDCVSNPNLALTYELNANSTFYRCFHHEQLYLGVLLNF
jgi:hypothetical protein